jgi:hypothetical protein
MYASFVRFYGHDAWYSSTWPTTDHIIPFKLFALMSGTIGHLQAAEQMTMTHAVAHAAALSMGDGKDLKLKRLTRQLVKRAYPEIVDGPA